MAMITKRRPRSEHRAEPADQRHQYDLADMLQWTSVSEASGRGSLKVAAQNASLTDVHWSMSGEIVLMTLVGGLGTVFGPWSAPS